MFILLLLLIQVGCDWVEISQNDYKKEAIHKASASFEFTTKASSSRKNVSSSAKLWNRGVVAKVPSVGNIRRVQFQSVKTSPLKTLFDDNEFNKTFKVLSEIPKALHSFSSKTYSNKLLNIQNETTELAVRSTADIDHRQVNQPNFSIKSVTTYPEINQGPAYHEEKQIHDTSILEINMDSQIKISEPPLTKINVKDYDKMNTDVKPNIRRVFLDKDELKSRFRTNSWPNYSSNKIANIQQNTSLPNEDNVKRLVSNYGENDVFKKKLSISVNTDYKVMNYSDLTKSQQQKPFRQPMRNFNSSHKFDFGYMTKKNYVEDSNKPIVSLNESYTNISDINSKMNIPKKTNNKKNEETTSFITKDISNTTKGNAVNGIWNLIKMVTDTIYKNTHRSFRSKIKYLKSLKSTILSSIENQIHDAWPDDVQNLPAVSRRARSAQARGHVEFPSSESTLMTISFLTFAVFLIKLVLQVIHTYKNKAMMVTPAVVAAVGRAATKLSSLK